MAPRDGQISVPYARGGQTAPQKRKIEGSMFLENEFGIKPGSKNGKRPYLTGLRPAASLVS